MANNTIYPYGTGGQAPSGIPIVNDLTTGGADKALSAQQGVVLDGRLSAVEDVVPSVDELKYKELKIDIVGCSASVQSFYINAGSNVWKTSTTTRCFFVNIIPGHKYRVTASGAQARIAILKSTTHTTDTTPDYATGETAMRTISANGTYTFTAPLDAKFLYANESVSSTVCTPSSMVDILPKDEYERDLEIGQPLVLFYGFGNSGYSVVADTTSATFGALKKISNDNYWGVTGYLNVENAIGVKFYCNKVSSASGVYGVFGAVFYDEDYEPMTEGAWTIENGSAAKAGYVVLSVPSGAKYIRYAIYCSASLNGTRERFYTWSRPIDNPEFPGLTYYGERIEVNPQYGYALSTIANAGMSSVQSGAVSGKYLFCVTEYIATMYCYNMETKTLLYTLTTGITQEDTCHANQSSFGTLKYDTDDMFPVLYISHARNSGGRGIVDAYRIVPTLTDGEISSFTITKVQRILLPTLTTANGLGYPNLVVDTENNAMWTYSRNTNSGESTSGLATFTRFAIPSLSSSEVTLEESSIKDSFMEKWNIANNQGAFIRRGKMYMMQGTGSSSSHNVLNVIDLYYKRCRVSYLDMYNYIAFEPEGVFYYGGNICCVTSGGLIRKLDF